MRILVVGSDDSPVDYEQETVPELRETPFLDATRDLGTHVADGSHVPSVVSDYRNTADFGVVTGANNLGRTESKPTIEVLRIRRDPRPVPFPDVDFPHVRFHRDYVECDGALYTDRRATKFALYDHILDQVDGVIAIAGSRNTSAAISQASRKGVPYVPYGGFGGAAAKWLETFEINAFANPRARAGAQALRAPWDPDLTPAALLDLLAVLQPPPVLPDVFISYPHGDREMATLLARELESRPDVTVWMDDRAVRPGDHLEQAVINAIEAMSVFIALRRGDQSASPWCLLEYSAADARCAKGDRVTVIPVIAAQDDPRRFAHACVVSDAHTPDRDIVRKIADRTETLIRDGKAG